MNIITRIAASVAVAVVTTAAFKYGSKAAFDKANKPAETKESESK